MGWKCYCSLPWVVNTLCDLGQITSSAEPYSFLTCKIVITLLYSCICFHTMFSSGNAFKYLWFLLIGYFHSHSWKPNVSITYCLSSSGTNHIFEKRGEERIQILWVFFYLTVFRFLIEVWLIYNVLVSSVSLNQVYHWITEHICIQLYIYSFSDSFPL